MHSHTQTHLPMKEFEEAEIWERNAFDWKDVCMDVWMWMDMDVCMWMYGCLWMDVDVFMYVCVFMCVSIFLCGYLCEMGMCVYECLFGWICV